MNWWEEIFDELYISVFSGFDEERNLWEVERIVETLNLPQDSKILDLCCGYGRHSIPLAERGYDMTGLDLSKAFLKKAKRDAKERNVKIRWSRGDMREIPFEDEFDAVINIFTSFGFFEKEEEDFKVLKKVNRCLKQGGKFLLDTINREYVIRNFQARDWDMIDKNTFVLDERKLDLNKNRIYTKNMFLSKSGGEERSFSVRLYTLSEMTGMLRKANLEVRNVFGSFNQTEYTIDSERMIILAKAIRKTKDIS